MSGFPFLSLPKKAQVNVLGEIRLLEIISFSLCSKRTKSLVTSLKLTTDEVRICVDHQINITLLIGEEWFKFIFYPGTDVAETEEFIPLPTPEAVEINSWTVDIETGGHAIGEFTCRKREYEFKNWVEHIHTILHHSEIDELRFDDDCDRFDVNSIADAVRGYPIVELRILGSHGRARIASQQALEVFYSTRSAVLDTNPFKEPKSIQKVLMRNYDQIAMDIPLTFADLLTINGLDITIFRGDWSGKVLNQFLKHWICGSNPRLAHLACSLITGKSEQLIFKDIKYTKFRDGRDREIRAFVPSAFGVMNNVWGGYDIKRRDGKIATITVDDMRGLCHINIMNFYTVFLFALLAIAAVSGHRCRGNSYGGGGGRGGGIIIGSKKD